MSAPHTFDACIIGAGAAGLFCAGVAGRLGLRVLLIDHSARVAEKIRISGGGRCNFTNIGTTPANFLSENPHFCRSALSRYTPQDFLSLVKKHGIAFHEKHKGQLFCDNSANDLIRMLVDECHAGGVERWQPCSVHEISKKSGENADRRLFHYEVCYEKESIQGKIECQHLVIATGGLSIPKIGASDFGYKIAKQFGHSLIDMRPALVPLTFDGAAWQPFTQLAGLALPVQISTGEKKAKMSFDEDLLFTHRGLSGPAVLQISSYWAPGQALQLNLCPGQDVAEQLQRTKQRSKKLLSNALSSELEPPIPSRLAEAWTSQKPEWQRPAAESSDKALAQLSEALARWQLTPTGSEGYAKAEVTRGGVNTRELSGQTMESQKSQGLYFIGEVVDVTGWLGGYNFQWAWASGYACAQAIAAAKATDSHV
jgi:predicted Rossmann fold flavoprotein